VAAGVVGAMDGTAGIDRGGESWGFRKLDLKEPGAEPIECMTVPTLLRKSGLTNIDLVKCDIEGSEAELFGACAEWIKSVRYLIVETHEPYSLGGLYRDLRHAGWKFKVVTEWEGNTISQCFLERVESTQ